jgi:4'-phosphopantetheinyl transferase
LQSLEFRMNLSQPVWGGFSGSYTLPQDEIHVWRTTLDMAASSFAKLLQILSPEERERADRFHFDVDRRRSVIGRGCLRLLLGEILDLRANELRIEYDEFGKPGLMPGQGQPPQFNVSHSGNLILIAITIGRAVGVDVERIRTDLDLDGIAARFFSANECKTLASLAGPARYKAFFTCWTRKEAYLKARGIGLSLPLDQFDVSFLPNEEPCLLATRDDPAEAKEWRLQALDVSDDYAAALAAPASAWKLKCWDWHPLPRIGVAASASLTD